MTQPTSVPDFVLPATTHSPTKGFSDAELELRELLFRRGNLSSQRATALANAKVFGAVSQARIAYEQAARKLETLYLSSSNATYEQLNAAEAECLAANARVITAMLELGYTDDFGTTWKLQDQFAGDAEKLRAANAYIDQQLRNVIPNCPWAFAMSQIPVPEGTTGPEMYNTWSHVMVDAVPNASSIPIRIDYEALELAIRFRIAFGITDQSYALGNELPEDPVMFEHVANHLLKAVGGEHSKTAAKKIVGPKAMAQFLELPEFTSSERTRTDDPVELEYRLGELLIEIGLLYGNQMRGGPSVVAGEIELARRDYAEAFGKSDVETLQSITNLAILNALLSNGYVDPRVDTTYDNSTLARRRFCGARMVSAQQKLTEVCALLPWADKATEDGPTYRGDYERLEILWRTRQACDITDPNYALGRHSPLIERELFTQVMQQETMRSREPSTVLTSSKDIFNLYHLDLGLELLGLEHDHSLVQLSDVVQTVVGLFTDAIEDDEKRIILHNWQIEVDETKATIAQQLAGSELHRFTRFRYGVWNNYGKALTVADATAAGWLTFGVSGVPGVITGLILTGVAFAGAGSVYEMHNDVQKEWSDVLNVQDPKAAQLLDTKLRRDAWDDGVRLKVNRMRRTHKPVLHAAQRKLNQLEAQQPEPPRISLFQKALIAGTTQKLVTELIPVIDETPWLSSLHFQDDETKDKEVMSIYDFANQLRVIHKVVEIRSRWVTEDAPEDIALPVTPETMHDPVFDRELSEVCGVLMTHGIKEPLRTLLGEDRAREHAAMLAEGRIALAPTISPRTLEQ